MVIRLFTTKINTSQIIMWKKNFNQKSTQLKNNWVFFLLPRKLEKLNQIAWSSKKLIKIALKKLPIVGIFSSHTLFIVYMWNSRKITTDGWRLMHNWEKFSFFAQHLTSRWTTIATASSTLFLPSRNSFPNSLFAYRCT